MRRCEPPAPLPQVPPPLTPPLAALGEEPDINSVA
jgi:hypothetical protein